MILRAQHTKNYTVISDAAVRDNRLSLREIGLLLRMLSLPDEWNFSIGGLAALCRDGKDAIRASIAQLEVCGYVQRIAYLDRGFKRYSYIVAESPALLEAYIASTRSDSRSAEIPTTEEPPTVWPSTVTPTQDSMDIEKPKQEILKNKNMNLQISLQSSLTARCAEASTLSSSPKPGASEPFVPFSLQEHREVYAKSVVRPKPASFGRGSRGKGTSRYTGGRCNPAATFTEVANSIVSRGRAEHATARQPGAP